MKNNFPSRLTKKLGGMRPTEQLTCPRRGLESEFCELKTKFGIRSGGTYGSIAIIIVVLTIVDGFLGLRFLEKQVSRYSDKILEMSSLEGKLIMFG